MIISASRRTDIPAFYADWFLYRIKKGHLKTRNPYNANHIRTIDLDPESIDCIVFWTKDPYNMIHRLNELSEYNFYFLFTLNAYPNHIEKNLRSKGKIIRCFQELSDLIGPHRIIWRYDPIILCNEFDARYHLKNFKEISNELNGFTTKCIVSFLDMYKKTIKRMKEFQITEMDRTRKIGFLDDLNEIASRNKIELAVCSESDDLISSDISKACCIDIDLINMISGKQLKYKKDKYQRKNCACNVSVDIGTYNTCEHNCIYCYANNNIIASGLGRKQDVTSPFLVGNTRSG